MTQDMPMVEPASKPFDGDTEFQRSQALDVLVESVSHLTRTGGRPPTASEVRLEMKRRTYNGFSPEALGYVRFRDFLAAAESTEIIRIDRQRKGDVAITLPSEQLAEVASPQLRSDIWKAFTDWNPEVIRYYDLEESRAIMLPREPAPLEPERYGSLRGRIANHPDLFIEIFPISQQAQLDWMAEHVQSVPSVEVQGMLQNALHEPKPAKNYVSVLRKFPELLAEWHSHLRERVYAEVMKWRDNNPRLSALDLIRPEIQHAGLPNASATSQSNTRADDRLRGISLLTLRRLAADRYADRPLFAFPSPTAQEYPVKPSSLRHMLHRAIDRMPESELKKLIIPIGYLFEE